MGRAEDKKNKILQAASECFARFGYEKTTMDDIGRLVGLNKASIYYYYKNKESIFMEVIFQERSKYIDALQKNINPAGTAREKIISYVVGRYRFIVEYSNLYNLSNESLNQIQPFFLDIYKTVIDGEVEFVRKLIEEGIKDNQLQPCDSKRVSAGVITIGDALKHREYAYATDAKAKEHDRERVEEEITYMCSLVLNGLAR